MPPSASATGPVPGPGSRPGPASDPVPDRGSASAACRGSVSAADPAPTPGTDPSAPARERILDAGWRLMRTIGLVRATTKEIARAADCSEAALYKHFSGKEELFVAVLRERLPPLGPTMAELIENPDGLSTEQCLAAIARTATLFYEASAPIAASLFADPALMRRHVGELHRLGAGPHHPLHALARYLSAERAAGRIRRDTDPDAAAALLLGACFQRALLAPFLEDAPEPLDSFAASLARTLVVGLTGF
ncbi:TetR/AcrR family transcriptional regulator [Streptacidiphilus cavernicola]|uniref:TetR/AcrR family transcriptional regulator n=1 Tax=Streptacidiphilus cavernicola TaxID=3342716 RepID=A0ABV6VSB1_9ACTN